MSTSKCSDYADPIYLTQFEIKDATDIAWSSSSIDLHLEITLEDRYFTMRDDINFPIVNFKFYITTFQHHMHMYYICLN